MLPDRVFWVTIASPSRKRPEYLFSRAGLSAFDIHAGDRFWLQTTPTSPLAKLVSPRQVV